MQNPPLNRTPEGRAPFINGEQVDFHKQSEHIKPASTFNRERELAEATKEATERAISAFAEEGIKKIEQHLKNPELSNEALAMSIGGVSKYVSALREQESK